MAGPPPTAPLSRADYDQLVASRMTEAALLAQVRQLARVLGWLEYHTHRSDRSPAGFPDLVLVHPVKARLIFAELKRVKGRTAPPQEAWLDALRDVADTVAGSARSGRPAVSVHLWRPTDLIDGSIEAALR